MELKAKTKSASEFFKIKLSFVVVRTNSSHFYNIQATPCNGERDFESRNADDQSSATSLFWMIILAYVLAGSGSAAMHPLGFSYIDDHASKHKSAGYIGERFPFLDEINVLLKIKEEQLLLSF